jgi:acylphosphatase
MCAADLSAPPKRMSIKVSAPKAVLAKLASSCRMEAGIKRGLTGVVYGLEGDRLEIVSEGKRLDKFIEWVSAFVNAECAAEGGECSVATVLAKDLTDAAAMYSAEFPVVNFNLNERKVKISLRGSQQVLDYTLRHMKIEASFHRKLEYSSAWQADTALDLEVWGAAPQLKSFVRWAKRGPPFQRAEIVEITWLSDSLEEATPLSTAFRDEGVVA